jgi:hypothetical protein
VTRRAELEDEDGIDGPEERAWQRARRQDERRAAAYARRMASYQAQLRAQQP